MRSLAGTSGPESSAINETPVDFYPIKGYLTPIYRLSGNQRCNNIFPKKEARANSNVKNNAYETT